ncbi:EF-hand domain-containing protein [Stigmatella aurantiaca]|uniref:EF hand domain protein n=1 Tax=Stigmatella aurantiaca (strain DW4/3-1) TaxID=378806 RepID=Q099X2_STIAD|nr:EF-hand domain-containing protein [Stigmatella aurantiaca]ADO73065.1 EF hand domain protein [Stigmatella aurantiaca DW4/3-1]EAU68505.1 EF hand domain protein [Stigmatella aurantiaca DW4/3-1]
MAKKKPGKKATAKQPAKRQSTAKKAARKAVAKKPARKAAAKKAARKAVAKPARKAAAKKAARKAAAKPARKAAAKKPARKAPVASSAKAAVKKAAPKVRKPAARQKVADLPESHEQEAQEGEEETFNEEQAQVVETTSAGIQPLAPEHAAVDDLTSTGNELLDIFQKYDRNRTGFIEAPEFARLLEALGQNITDEDLQIAFDIIDIDRSGKISWKQFKNWWTSR